MIAPAGEFVRSDMCRFFAEDDEAAIGGLVHAGDQVQERGFCPNPRDPSAHEFAA